ncbi:MAG: hypothetical protein E6G92_06125 [Alphaproteobacteria bacterium]|nr:MAG: hypothetical protein E6G92_06125 [Alphaproteobacteria bacterium]
MVSGIVLLVIVVMRLFPAIPLSRALHRALVEAPLERLGAMSRRHLIYAALLAGMMIAGAEVILLLGSADMAMLMAWDVSLYVDGLIATWTISALVRGKSAWNVVAARWLSPLRRAARPRARRQRRDPTRTAANDSDEGGGGRAYAFAA